MDIKQIKTFIVVANSLNFTKAAEELFMTQSSVSKIIRSLEEELEGVLFHRTPRIELTDVGKEFLKKAIEVISLVESIPEEISHYQMNPRGNIHIGIPPIIGASFFPRFIGDFKRMYPDINIRLVEEGSKSIIELLKESSLDIGIVCSYPEEDMGFSTMEFVKSPLMVVMNKSNPLSQKEEIGFSDLKNQEFVLFQEDFSLYDQVVAGCLKHGFHPKIICNSSQRDFILEMVKADLGVTLLPEIITESIVDNNLKIIPLIEPKIFLNLLMIWSNNRYKSTATREWIRYVNSHQ